MLYVEVIPDNPDGSEELLSFIWHLAFLCLSPYEADIQECAWDGEVHPGNRV